MSTVFEPFRSEGVNSVAQPVDGHQNVEKLLGLSLGIEDDAGGCLLTEHQGDHQVEILPATAAVESEPVLARFTEICCILASITWTLTSQNFSYGISLLIQRKVGPNSGQSTLAVIVTL